jgi:hypothetical protein
MSESIPDPEKLYRIEFTLRFPTKIAADRAELELIGLAFETKVEPGKTASERVIRAFKVMYPNEPDLAGLRDKLNDIAAQNHGSYDGWKAKPYVRKPAAQ